MKNIGVLSYQGAGHLFIIALTALGYRAHKIFFYSNLTNLDGIILPGGESSVQYDYCVDNRLDKKIYEFYKSKKTYTWYLCWCNLTFYALFSESQRT